MRWPMGKRPTLVLALVGVGVVLLAVFALRRDGGTASERSDAGLDPDYATMTYRSSGGPGPCDTWEQVSPEPLANTRPARAAPATS